MSYSQNRIHIYGGLNLNDYRFPDNPYDFNELYNPNFGPHIGIFTELPLNQKLFLRPQLQFIMRGSYFKNEPTHTEARTNLIYAELPVLLGYQISNLFSIAIGPSVGYKLYAYGKADGKTEKLESFPENEFDFGITSAFGWKASENWTFLLSSYFGLTAIHKYDVFNTQTFDLMPVSFANVGLQISAAYKFPAKDPAKEKSKPPFGRR